MFCVLQQWLSLHSLCMWYVRIRIHARRQLLSWREGQRHQVPGQKLSSSLKEPVAMENASLFLNQVNSSAFYSSGSTGEVIKCNKQCSSEALMFRCIELQMVEHCLVRAIIKSPKYHQIVPLLPSLHSLATEQRIH